MLEYAWLVNVHCVINTQYISAAVLAREIVPNYFARIDYPPSIDGTNHHRRALETRIPYV